MKRFLISVVILFTFHGWFAFSVENTKKKTTTKSYKSALVIGNSKYTKIRPLSYAREDAEKISKVLEGLGFNVTFLGDADRRKFKNGIREWAKNLQEGGVALFHYTGHGMQSEGNNYLIPVDANVISGDEIEFESINAKYILKKMKSAKCRSNIIILDACREDPFSFENYNKGFAEMQPWYGCIIIYSTRIGETANDKHSFSSFLYTQLKNNPKMELKDMLDEVRNNVVRHTSGKQVPIEIQSFPQKFYFPEMYENEEIEPLDMDLQYIIPKPIRKKFLVYECRKNLYPEIVRLIIKDTGFFDFCLNPVKSFINQFEIRKIGRSIVIIDSSTDLMWHDSGSEPLPRESIEDWLDQLNDNKYAGYDDWRMPTLEEAASLLSNIKDKKNNLYIDPRFSRNQRIIWTCDRSPKEMYNDESLDLYWAVDFENGIVARFDANSEISVRPVRKHY